MDKWFKKYSSDYLIIGLCLALFVVFFFLSYRSDGSYIGGDNYERFLIAKYAFRYPGNFLNHWAKPIFIALSSPFAQLGYRGFKLFNIIIGILTSFFAYSICKKLKFDNSWLVIFFVCFAPIFYMMTFTGMTEIFFGFIIMLSIFFIIKDKYILSAIVLSFLPIIRNEGIAIWLLFIFIYIIRKKYKAIPFLLTGFLLYSIIGWFYYHDFWWLITQNPYNPGTNDVYGHGNWNFYFTNLRFTLGIPLTILFIPGFLAVVYEIIIKNKLKTFFSNKDSQIIFLVLSVFIAYFSIHSILWWKGWMSVLGDVRFMAAVTPFAAIIGLKGFNALLYYLRRFKIIIFIISISTGVLFIRTAQFFYEMPVHFQGTDAVVKATSVWMLEQNIKKNKIYYCDPLFPVTLGLNPYDDTKAHTYIGTMDKLDEVLLKGEVVIWDAHFSPNEGRQPLNSFLNNKDFALLKVFKPDQPFTVLGGYNYEIYVFQRK